MEHYKARYGDWAGNPKGFAPDYARCCEEVFGDRGHGHQCQRPNGHGPDGAYCAAHDPERVARRRAEKAAKDEAAWKADSIKYAAPRLLRALRLIADGAADPAAVARAAINGLDKQESKP